MRRADTPNVHEDKLLEDWIVVNQDTSAAQANGMIIATPIPNNMFVTLGLNIENIPAALQKLFWGFIKGAWDAVVGVPKDIIALPKFLLYSLPLQIFNAVAKVGKFSWNIICGLFNIITGTASQTTFLQQFISMIKDFITMISEKIFEIINHVHHNTAHFLGYLMGCAGMNTLIGFGFLELSVLFTRIRTLIVEIEIFNTGNTVRADILPMLRTLKDYCNHTFARPIVRRVNAVTFDETPKSPKDNEETTEERHSEREADTKNSVPFAPGKLIDSQYRATVDNAHVIQENNGVIPKYMSNAPVMRP